MSLVVFPPRQHDIFHIDDLRYLSEHDLRYELVRLHHGLFRALACRSWVGEQCFHCGMIMTSFGRSRIDRV